MTLVEAESSLGGQVARARMLKGRERLGVLVDDLYAEALRRGVDVRLGLKLGDPGPGAPAPVDVAAFDHIVVAAGARSLRRSLPGAEENGVEVLDAESAVVALEAGSWRQPRRIAVVDDEGSWIAAGLVEALGRGGHRVHLVAPSPQLFGRVTLYSRAGLLDRLRAFDVSSHLARRPKAIAETGLLLQDVVGGADASEVVPGIDLVIDLPARVARTELLAWLAARGVEERVVVVGDALAPRTLVEATYEAHRAVLHVLAAPTPTPVLSIS